ncbi:MAG TPA: hypothetical protein PLK12_16205, partial [Prolixibacteraceae bacterium]|nr:hypothetical protein [Prolixibacteraceae bacterium]
KRKFFFGELETFLLWCNYPDWVYRKGLCIPDETLNLNLNLSLSLSLSLSLNLSYRTLVLGFIFRR